MQYGKVNFASKFILLFRGLHVHMYVSQSGYNLPWSDAMSFRVEQTIVLLLMEKSRLL